ncbi:MAG: LemA family protein [Oscillospiraceae bacterium]|jgi:LemA protein|nr:LemA family protein [Oscillospiraceae bacterium]
MQEVKRKNRVLMTLLAVFIVSVLAAIGYAVSIRNGFVLAKVDVEKSLADISVQLQRRNDLIPSLVNVVKGYAKHEESVFSAVTAARERMMGAKTPEEMSAADAELTQGLGRLLLVAEAYPELRANELFLSLQDEIAGTENRIAVSRRAFNEQATRFNSMVNLFPKNLFAKMFGFKEVAVFAAGKSAKTVPTVSFD